jgi:hypothetical protein
MTVTQSGATFERIIRLGGLTDAHQQFMFQQITIQPQDARDVIAYLATQGILITAHPIDEQGGDRLPQGG